VILDAGVSLAPVLVFLAGLTALDSFKLLKVQSILLAIGAGCIAAFLALALNSRILQTTDIELMIFSKYIAPLLEELLKAVYVIFLIRTKKVGFLVDAAIFGFAVGAGFAVIENIYYLGAVMNADTFLWVIRGFGTAVMHGSTTAIFAILSKNLADRKSSGSPVYYGPGFIIAVLIHSFYNHFFLSPLVTTVSMLIVLPLIVILVFYHSEKTTRDWLGIGLDKDMELLRLITGGNISDTKVGAYLHSMTERFPGHVVGDMLCYLRIYLELSVRAKGILIMKETGFNPPPDPEVRAKFTELNFLERSIGKTGKLALFPLLRLSNRDLWQLNFLSATH
jgi:protease PrsW